MRSAYKIPERHTFFRLLKLKRILINLQKLYAQQCFFCQWQSFLGHCKKKFGLFCTFHFTRYKYIPYRKKWACTKIFDFFVQKNTDAQDCPQICQIYGDCPEICQIYGQDWSTNVHKSVRFVVVSFF